MQFNMHYFPIIIHKVYIHDMIHLYIKKNCDKLIWKLHREIARPDSGCSLDGIKEVVFFSLALLLPILSNLLFGMAWCCHFSAKKKPRRWWWWWRCWSNLLWLFSISYTFAFPLLHDFNRFLLDIKIMRWWRIYLCTTVATTGLQVETSQ